jgi:protein-S-isoprenylcysteine O-methyltransferase Ste14
MTLAPYLVLVLGWIIWMIPFLRMRRKSSAGPAQTVDRRARIGIALQSVGFFLCAVQSMKPAEPHPIRLIAEIIFLTLGCTLAIAALRALGKFWRIEAGLSPDHQLIRTGPYKIVRHPIYLSMFCMLLAIGMARAAPIWLAAGALVFLCGTEYRTRIEDGLLRSRFGEQFDQYRSTVPAYLPFIR